MKRRILRWDSGCLNNRLHSLCKVDWPILRWDMTSNLAVVYTIRIRAPSPKWIGINTVGCWMLQQHRPQKVQNSPKFSASPQHIAVVYTNRIRKPAQSGLAYTTVGFRMLQQLVQSELAYPCRLAGVYVSFTWPCLSICQNPPTLHRAGVYISFIVLRLNIYQNYSRVLAFFVFPAVSPVYMSLSQGRV